MIQHCDSFLKKNNSFRYLSVLFLLIFILTASSAASADEIIIYDDGYPEPENYPQESPLYVPGEIFVKYDPELITASALSEDVIASFPELVPGLHLIRLPEGVSVEDAVEYFESQPGVIYAEPNYYLDSFSSDSSDNDIFDMSTGGVFDGSGSYDAGIPDLSGNGENIYVPYRTIADDRLHAHSAYPSAPLFKYQWGLQNTGQYLPELGSVTTDNSSFPLTWFKGIPAADSRISGAWDLTTGNKNIVVAVIDSGVLMTHPDLSHAIYHNPGEIDGNGIDDDGNGYIDDVCGWDFVSNDNDPTDEYGHGTHCAGIIAGSGYGVLGTAPNVTILPIRFLDANGRGTTIGREISAIIYAQNAGAQIASCSYGGPVFSQAQYEAIKNSRLLFVCAAGNDGPETENYPSGYDLDNIISVAAGTQNDKLAYFSNCNQTTTDLSAPGVYILSSYITNGSAPRPAWSSLYGTSMATPFVSGTAALMLSVNPSLNASQIRTILTESTDFIPAQAGKTVSGGRLNASAAVRASQKAKYGTLPFSIKNYSASSIRIFSPEETDILYVQAEGSRNGHTEYIWEYYNGSGWEFDNRSHSNVFKADYSDNGKIFRCTVVDMDALTWIKTGNMTVWTGTVAPVILSQPADISASAGSNISFRTNATDPSDYWSLIFTWQKRTGDKWVNVTASRGYPDSSSVQYGICQLKNITPADAGVYRCVVSDLEGTSVTYECTLEVTRRISFTLPDGTIIESVNLTKPDQYITAPDMISTEGKVFLSWKDNSGNTYDAGDQVTSDRSKILTADTKPVNIEFLPDPAENIRMMVDYTAGIKTQISDTDENYDIDQNGIIDGRDVILLEKYVSSLNRSSYISITDWTPSLTEGDRSLFTACGGSSSGSESGIFWGSSDMSVGTIDQTGRFTAKSPGTTVITASLKDDPTVNISRTVSVSGSDLRSSQSVQYYNPLPDIFLENQSFVKHWNFSLGFYRTCTYYLKNNGQADGTADVSIFSDVKGHLVTIPEYVPAETTIRNTTIADTWMEDSYIYYEITNVTKQGDYYGGYTAKVSLNVTNPSPYNKKGKIIIQDSNGTTYATDYISVPAKSSVNYNKNILLNKDTAVSAYVSQMKDAHIPVTFTLLNENSQIIPTLQKLSLGADGTPITLKEKVGIFTVCDLSTDRIIIPEYADADKTPLNYNTTILGITNPKDGIDTTIPKNSVGVENGMFFGDLNKSRTASVSEATVQMPSGTFSVSAAYPGYKPDLRHNHSIVLRETSPTDVVVVYMVRQNAYNFVKYDANGGKGDLPVLCRYTTWQGAVQVVVDSVPGVYAAQAGENVAVIGSGGLTNGNRTFLGWNTEADGTGIMYRQGDIINFTVAGDEKGDVILYAVWS